MTTETQTKAGLEKARETAERLRPTVKEIVGDGSDGQGNDETIKRIPQENISGKRGETVITKVNKELRSETPKVFTGGTFGKFTIRKAQRSNAKLRIGLAGPSGSGKTYSALLLAHGLAEWHEIAIIDTENGSADLYSDLGAYNVLTLEKPFHPERYVEAINAAISAGMKVVIVDSITHEWSGEGGALQLQEQLGGRFQDWAKVTPLHNKFVRTIIDSPIHMITTVRSKTDYAMSQDGGRSKVQKVGLKPETREGFEYEMTLSFDLNINNMADVSKDRTGIFKGKAPFVITEDTGKALLKWTESGIDYVTEIKRLLVKKGKTQDPILSTFKVLALDELTHAQFKQTITKLETLPDWTPEMQKAKEEAEKKEQEAKELEEKRLAEERQKVADEEKKKAEEQAKIDKENEIDVDEVDAGIAAMRAERGEQ